MIHAGEFLQFCAQRLPSRSRQGGARGASASQFYLFDDEARFEGSTEKLAEALSTDIDWIRKHTEFGEQTLAG